MRPNKMGNNGSYDETMEVLKGVQYTKEELDLPEGAFEIVWRPDFKQKEGLIGFNRSRWLIIPSGVNEKPPLDDLNRCFTRSEPAIPGMREVVVPIMQDNRWIGYPADLPDRSPLLGLMPGVSEPVDICWETNPQGERRNVYARLSFPNSPDAHCKVFMGQNQNMRKFSPYPDQSQEWREMPLPGDTTQCWVGWNLQYGHWVGFAYLIQSEAQSQNTDMVVPAGRQEVPVTSIATTRVVVVGRETYTIILPSSDLSAQAFIDGDEQLIIKINLKN